MLQTSLNELPGYAPGLPLPVIEDSRSTFDLKLAKAVQRQMLPRSPRRLNTVECAGISTAASGIGGDYYDFLDLGQKSLGFVLADISGKGIAAALLMANLQASIRCECARGFRNLNTMLQRVNSHFLNSTLPAQYATLFFGQYDDRTRRLNYINCGQQPAIIVRADRSVERLETTAAPLGLFSDWTGLRNQVQLRPGDSVFVCSDGVTDAGLENGYEFGEAGLISVVTANTDQNIETAVARIAQAAHLYETDGPADDMTVAGISVV